MKPRTTRATLPPKQSHSKQTAENVQQPLIPASLHTSNRQTSFAQAMPNYTGYNSFVSTGM